MVTVVKADGTSVLFDREKVFKTCLKLCGSTELAEKVSKRVEEQVYDGISTREILSLVFRVMSEYKPAMSYRVDLRTSLSLLRSKPDFENFISQIFRSLGYEVKRNIIVQGFCIEHEVDALASKDGEVVYIEVKHHMNPHKYVDLDVVEKVWATILDIREGFDNGLNSMSISKPLVATNTKFTNHAYRYAKCRGINLLGWSVADGMDLEKLITEFKLYPVTILKGFDLNTLYKVIDVGCVTVKQLADSNVSKLLEAGLTEDEANLLIERAREVLKILP
ncbi:MAG: restriction endonuclease [Candidatus Bathyarchaeia archaeon]